ncbi:MAG: class I SAM-dependent methyltransferase [Planctomycetota bacterium]
MTEEEANDRYPEERTVEGCAGVSLMDPAEREAILEAIPSDRPQMVLEFGTFCGATARWLADRRRLTTFVTVDDYSAFPDRCPVEAVANYRAAKYRNLRLVAATTRQFAALWTDRAWDMVIVDAQHLHEFVARDLNYARDLVRPGGLVVAHDYGHSYWTGCTQAIDEAIAAGRYRLFKTHMLLAFLEPQQ